MFKERRMDNRRDSGLSATRTPTMPRSLLTSSTTLNSRGRLSMSLRHSPNPNANCRSLERLRPSKIQWQDWIFLSRILELIRLISNWRTTSLSGDPSRTLRSCRLTNKTVHLTSSLLDLDLCALRNQMTPRELSTRLQRHHSREDNCTSISIKERKSESRNCRRTMTERSWIRLEWRMILPHNSWINLVANLECRTWSICYSNCSTCKVDSQVWLDSNSLATWEETREVLHTTEEEISIQEDPMETSSQDQ